ncbi:MAG TPA: 50S ribosomal protein L11 methyltransferase [Pseudomonadales bacterium]|nr:50S ribosomal protein L11 methyltransferase [Pseudomonadales bacterium]HNI37181.1 50S ribosomal protein L11 methyltransferase [Pseudomonadales bacterium]HNN85879.1 50S ribosomal protein L11 methyltransferase [Pseudomonadales bacterium]
MNWLQCFLRVSRQQVDVYEDALLALGAVSVTYCDAADQPLFEPGPGEIALWEDVELVGLFTEDFHESDLRAQLAEIFDGGLPSLRFEVLADQVWERTWMEHFQPMRFGERLWIYPSWTDAPDDGSVVLRLDPGLAFGTGTHPTTALCLEWLDAQSPQGKTVIDYGCGSGILAIAALLLGAACATGYDNDPQALTASRDNAAHNHCAEKLTLALVATGGADITEQADVVLANILAGPLRELAPRIAPLVKHGGSLVLSGILAEQAEDVMDAYRVFGFVFNAPAEREGWVRLVGKQAEN